MQGENSMNSTYIITGLAFALAFGVFGFYRAITSKRTDRLGVNINFDKAKDRETRYRY